MCYNRLFTFFELDLPLLFNIVPIILLLAHPSATVGWITLP